MTTARSARPWPTYALGALCLGAIVIAALIVGPASGSTSSSTDRTITVAQGVVQSTVSGSGNIQAASQLNLGFKTSGVVTRIYATQGARVTEGQLLAELNPTSAEVTLEQAKASLQAAEASLAQEEETDGETSTSAGSTDAGASHATASAASTTATIAANRAYAAYTPPTTTTPTTTTTPATTAPATSTAAPTSTGSSTSAAGTTNPPTTTTTTTPAQTAPSTKTTSSAGTTNEAGTHSTGSNSSSPTATLSTATRAANLASARATVKSDKLTVQSAEEALANTKLFAPESGTLVTLSGEVGETVTGSGTTKSSSSSSSSNGSGSGDSAASALGGAAATGSGASASDSSSGSSSSSSFAVLSDLSSMQLVVALSESEVGSVRVGQPAAVTIEALESTKLAAHVLSVATLPTSTSGVVSYDVTFQLDQLASGLKPGMSATAEVVVKQAEGVNVPTTAISADTVTVARGGKDVRQRVVTGLAGNSSTIILSGLKAGEEIVLPVARTSSTSSLTSRLGARVGGALAGAAGGGFGGAPGGGFGGGGFRGG